MVLSSYIRDLEQIREDDLEAMDLKWQLSFYVEHQEARKVFMGDMAEEQVQTNMALMAFSDSETTTLKEVLATSRRNKLLIIEKNEVLFSEEVVTVLKEKPNKLDLSYSGLDEFKEPEFKGYGTENIVNAVRVNQANAVKGKPQQDDPRFVDSGCSRHMTRNIAYLSNFKEFDGGYVAFGGGAHGGRITGKGTLKNDSLDFEDIAAKANLAYYFKELKESFQSELGNIRDLEGDEEKLIDVVVKLETSFDVLSWSLYTAAKKKEKGMMWPISKPRME
ncbi:hypothetical protein Tco_0778891 [Tanacetum coccineum]